MRCTIRSAAADAGTGTPINSGAAELAREHRTLVAVELIVTHASVAARGCFLIDRANPFGSIRGLGKRSPHEATCQRIASGFSSRTQHVCHLSRFTLRVRLVDRSSVRSGPDRGSSATCHRHHRYLAHVLATSELRRLPRALRRGATVDLLWLRR